MSSTRALVLVFAGRHWQAVGTSCLRELAGRKILISKSKSPLYYSPANRLRWRRWLRPLVGTTRSARHVAAGSGVLTVRKARTVSSAGQDGRQANIEQFACGSAIVLDISASSRSDHVQKICSESSARQHGRQRAGRRQTTGVFHRRQQRLNRGHFPLRFTVYAPH